MRTKLTIVAIVLACAAAAIAALVDLVMWLGWPGALIWTGTAAVVLAIYVRFVRPWHLRWGATDEEIACSMPGDEIIPNAASSTRAITVDVTPRQLWPWLVQIGYGRAGWYSYDWIDNDGKRSSDRIVPELQHLAPGDVIPMLPDFGPPVLEVKPERYFLAGGEDGTWCLAVYPTNTGSRLVSRWRMNWKPHGMGSRFFTLLSDPGAFIMEQKMLRGIKKRAEAVRVMPPNERHKEVA